MFDRSDLPKFRGQSRASTWLTTIPVNTCRSYARKRFRRLHWSVLWRARYGDRPEPPTELQLMDHERFERVRQALGRLPSKYREVIVLRYLEELAIPEIAEVLGLRRNAVEVRLARARKRLREGRTKRV